MDGTTDRSGMAGDSPSEAELRALKSAEGKSASVGKLRGRIQRMGEQAEEYRRARPVQCFGSRHCCRPGAGSLTIEDNATETICLNLRESLDGVLRKPRAAFGKYFSYLKTVPGRRSGLVQNNQWT